MVTLSPAPQSVSPDLVVTMVQTDIDLTRGPDATREMLRAAIARHGGYCDWGVDHSGWVVTLYLPEERTFSGGTLEDGLAACLAWLVAAASNQLSVESGDTSRESEVVGQRGGGTVRARS